MAEKALTQRRETNHDMRHSSSRAVSLTILAVPRARGLDIPSADFRHIRAKAFAAVLLALGCRLIVGLTILRPGNARLSRMLPARPQCHTPVWTAKRASQATLRFKP
jgi:hypothetical protein